MRNTLPSELDIPLTLNDMSPTESPKGNYNPSKFPIGHSRFYYLYYMDVQPKSGRQVMTMVITRVTGVGALAMVNCFDPPANTKKCHSSNSMVSERWGGVLMEFATIHSNKSFGIPIWLWLKKPVPKMACPGKWQNGNQDLRFAPQIVSF